MKTMTVFEAKNNFSRTLEAAKRDIVIVTRNGKPVAAIQSITDEDIEDLLLERSEKFWQMIGRARMGKAVSLSALRHKLVRSAPTKGVKRGKRRQSRAPEK
jgi:prevent-host-death family protein